MKKPCHTHSRSAGQRAGWASHDTLRAALVGALLSGLIGAGTPTPHHAQPPASLGATLEGVEPLCRQGRAAARALSSPRTLWTLIAGQAPGDWQRR